MKSRTYIKFSNKASRRLVTLFDHMHSVVESSFEMENWIGSTTEVEKLVKLTQQNLGLEADDTVAIDRKLVKKLAKETGACLLGWGTVNKKLYKQGLRMEFNDVCGEPAYREGDGKLYGTFAAAAFFDIPFAAAFYLFSHHKEGEEDIRHVCQRLGQFIMNPDFRKIEKMLEDLDEFDQYEAVIAALKAPVSPSMLITF